jgi:hypothetical protein
MMLDSFANYFWAHPVAIAGTAIAVIIILIWMTGSGSRQRFITFKRTKETDQLARDLSRIAAALERIARSQETPTDYVGRQIPPGWEESISAGEPSEDGAPQTPATANPESVEAAMAADAHAHATHGDEAHRESAVLHSNASAAHPANAVPVPPPPARENQPASFTNPLGRTADLLGKKKLDLPNPLYRPK